MGERSAGAARRDIARSGRNTHAAPGRIAGRIARRLGLRQNPPIPDPGGLRNGGVRRNPPVRLRPRPAVPAAESDRMLAERLRARDGSGLASLYDLYGGAVYSIALRILKSGGDAEEVTQEVFLYAWERAELFDAARGS